MTTVLSRPTLAVLIPPARADDLASARQVMAAAGMGSTLPADNPVGSPRQAVLVADCPDSGIVGCVEVHLHDRCCGIWNLAVHPRRWREGIGRAVLAAAHACALADGASNACLVVEAANIGARALYSGFGYRMVREEGGSILMWTRLGLFAARAHVEHTSTTHGSETTALPKRLPVLKANPGPMVQMITEVVVTPPDSEDIDWISDEELN